jgi:hypothetical protein
MRLIKLISIIGLILCLGEAWANPAAESHLRKKEPEQKFNFTPTSSMIQMEAEEVNLIQGKNYLKVKGVYHMKNLGGAVNIQEGFPLSDNSYALEVKINGKKVDIKIGNYIKNAFQLAYKHYNSCMFWDNYYSEDSNLTIEVSYVEKQEIVNDLVFGVYFLQTGASWYGNIGKTVVTMTFEDGLSPLNLRQISRRNNAVISKNKVTWTFNNWEPTESDDIVFYLNPEKDYSKLLNEYKKAEGAQKDSITWKNTKELAELAMLHDRKTYWYLAEKLIRFGTIMNDGKIIITPKDDSENNNITWYFTEVADSVFHEALQNYNNDPRAKELLLFAAYLIERLINGKVSLDNTKRVDAFGEKGKLEVIKLGKSEEEIKKLRSDITYANKLIDDSMRIKQKRN